MSTPLPSPDAPVERVQRDGKRFIALPTPMEAEKIVHKTRVRLADITQPKLANPIVVVIGYELIGLSIEDIAIATGMSVGQINSLKINPAYTDLRKRMIDEIYDSSKSEVKQIFSDNASKAAGRIVELVDSARGNVALKAGELVLKGSGYSMDPATVKPNDPMASGLTIVFVGNKEDGPPVVSLEHDDA